MENENEWWGRLGVEPPAGEKEPEVTEPATQPAAPESGKAPEVTDPAAAEERGSERTGAAAIAETESGGKSAEEPSSAGADGDPAPAGKPEGKPQEMSPEERHRQANVRKETDRQQMEQQIRAEMNERYRRAIAAMGVKDNDNGGKPVETLEDLERVQAKQRTAQIQRDLKAGKLTPEAIRTAVLEAPEIQEILRAANDAKTAAGEAEHKARMAQYNAAMQTELAEIRKMNPAIKTTDDIIRMETGPEYARLLRTGLRPSEAYKLANFEQLQSTARSAAEQAARNAAAGKAHMQPTPTQGQQPLAVPEEYKAQMRRINRGITDAEIAKYYQRFQKERS